MRGVILTGLLTGAGIIVYRMLVKPLSEPTDDLSLALRVEERFPSLNDALASTMQFLERGDAGGPQGESQSLRRETVRQRPSADPTALELPCASSMRAA